MAADDDSRCRRVKRRRLKDSVAYRNGRSRKMGRARCLRGARLGRIVSLLSWLMASMKRDKATLGASFQAASHASVTRMLNLISTIVAAPSAITTSLRAQDAMSIATCRCLHHRGGYHSRPSAPSAHVNIAPSQLNAVMGCRSSFAGDFNCLAIWPAARTIFPPLCHRQPSRLDGHRLMAAEILGRWACADITRPA